MNDLDLSRKVADCMVATAWVKPESVKVDRPEIFQLTNTVAPYNFLNGVMRTQLRSEEEMAQISSVYAEYKAKKIPFRWFSFPHSEPVDLNARLEKLGPHVVIEMQGLYILQENYPLQLPSNIGVEILSAQNLLEYSLTNTQGWGQKGAEAQRIQTEIANDFKMGASPNYSFLVRYRGEPAGTGMMRIVDNAGYLFASSVRPEFRGKGVYRALVAHRLGLLKALGIASTFILARKATSAPICRRMGFQLACDCRSYDFSF